MPTELKVIMFTDEANSTASMKGRTPDETRKVTDDKNSLTADAVGRCRGVILKDTGDGHMIEFRSCADAVRCGFLIQQNVKERNDVQRNERLKFEFHVGIDFGEAVVLDDGDLRANAANQAARVSDKSNEGEVYFTKKVADELNVREAVFIELPKKFDLKDVGKVPPFRLQQWSGKIKSSHNPYPYQSLT